jgi:hypothetical protein
MAKYIIDIDSFKECLDFAAFSKVNGQPVAFIYDIKVFIDKFPKEPLNIPNLMVKGEIE